MPGWMRKRVLIWATGASATVAGLSLITPIMVDTLFDVIQIGLVYLAAAVARQS